MDEGDLRTYARLLRAVAHPTRLRILYELIPGTRCVGNICDLLAMPQPNVSQHLAMLKQHGLVVCDKQGALRCYRLSNPGLVEGLLALLHTEARPGEPSYPPAETLPV
jgi:ArsR family transcriptional regulator, arsenate/arsenite/antimonite-responsive transcriptional repressor